MAVLSVPKRIMSFRKRVTIILVGVAIGGASLLSTYRMASLLREKEQFDVQLWAYAMGRVGEFGNDDPLIFRIINSRNNIPFVITDDNLHVEAAYRISDEVLSNPDLLRRKCEELAGINQPLEINNVFNGNRYYLFYGRSALLKMLVYFPVIQLLVISAFVVFGFVAFRSTKQDEQNRVWIGLAKETAHQLGTPTSSLLGWIEYLRNQPVDQTAVEEMNKDLQHLMKIVDRFSKIGSHTQLSEGNINEIVSTCVSYFRTRIPRNVTLDYNGLAMAPVQAMVNGALFEWVVENLLKNALDALQGRGALSVKISDDANCVYIDVRDTGKGIAKQNWKRIFEPGFTTKTRGWGLGLSLSRRIIEEYHKGRIFVLDSEPGRGTTIRIALKKLYG